MSKNQMNGARDGAHLPSLRLGLLLLACLTAFGVVACSDDEGSDSIQDNLRPQLAVSPGTLDFNLVSIGSEDVKTLTIRNNGEGDLTLKSIRLTEEEGDGVDEFHRGSDWVRGNRTLAPDEALTVSVIYRPLNRERDAGYIEIESNDPENDGIHRVSLNTPPLMPEIFSDSVVRFNRVPAGSTSTMPLQVSNIGHVPLRIDQVVLDESSDFSIAFMAGPNTAPDDGTDTDVWPESLDPDESMWIRVTFSPENDDPSESELVIFSNDPNTPEHRVDLIGNSNTPCIILSQEQEVNFGESSIGQQAPRTIVIENCSATAELKVSEIAIVDDEDDVFDIVPETLPEGLPDEEAVIAPRTTASFVITYTPESSDLSDATLVVKSNDPAKSEMEIPVVGVGTDNKCPTAVAEARVQGTSRWNHEVTTLPLNTVELNALNSFDPDGNINHYEWTIISKPSGSLSRPQPGADRPQPTLYLDVAGTYEIELTVTDNQGLANCGNRAIVTVRAIPQDDIHVQLVWDTPAVTDPGENNGTDLDLHYLHPNGQWNHPPHDIYWYNTTADWGVPGDTTDDPRLDIDNVWGTGPENVNHSKPEANTDYAVGVNYFADHGFGASYATVRIYIRGELRLEVENTYLEHQGYFWYAAIIKWPSTDVIRRDHVEFGFPNR